MERDRAESPPRVADMFEDLYGRLYARAKSLMAGERRDHTLEPGALLHEVYLRLGASPGLSWRSETHFESLASRTMRRVLVDHAKSAARQKRCAPSVTLAENLVTAKPLETDLLDLDQAIERLAATDSRAAEVLELRLFAPMSVREVAEALGMTYDRAKNDWLYARAWLARELSA